MIAAVVALLVGVAIACPTPDVLTLILGLALALIPFVILITLTIRLIRKRGFLLSLRMSILLGGVIGVSIGYLSVSAFRLASYVLT